MKKTATVLAALALVAMTAPTASAADFKPEIILDVDGLPVDGPDDSPGTKHRCAGDMDSNCYYCSRGGGSTAYDWGNCDGGHSGYDWAYCGGYYVAERCIIGF